jgi:hypothetical protein
MVVPPWVVHAAVFVVTVPPAIQVPTMGVAMDMAPVSFAAWMVDLTVLVITVPPAIQMTAVRVAVDMTVVMPMPMVAVDVLRFLHEGSGTFHCGGRRCMGAGAGQRQNEASEE